MKKLIALALLLCSPAFASQVIGVVKELKGTAYSQVGKQRTMLAPGSELVDGTKLVTAQDSEARVLLNDAAMDIKANSEIEIKRQHDKDWIVNLRRGALMSVVKNAEKRPNHYQVKTKSAVMGVRGTMFFVRADGDKDFFCPCMGSIAVTSGGAKPVVFTSKHHDRPVVIVAGKGSLDSRMKDAGMGGEHTDDEAAALKALIP